MSKPKLKLVVYLLVLMGATLSVSHVFAQFDKYGIYDLSADKISIPNRSNYLLFTLTLSQNASSAYQNALRERAFLVEQQEREITDVSVYGHIIDDIESSFNQKVKTIFPEVIYNKWAQTIQGDPMVRYYVEVLGLSSNQIIYFKKVSREYWDDVKKLWSLSVSQKEKNLQRKQLMDSYLDKLKLEIPADVAHTIYDNFLIVKELNFTMKTYPFLSIAKAKKYSSLKFRYEQETLELLEQSLPDDQLEKARKHLHDAFSTQVQQLFSESEYIMWRNKKEKYADGYLLRIYNINAEQLKEYKSLMNSFAIQKYKVTRMYVDKAQRMSEYDLIRTGFEQQMRALLGDSYDVWANNNSYFLDFH